jgi:hypothetical protein
MEPLAVHRCVEVKQEIGWIEKRTVETSFDLLLYEDRIEVKDSSYPIKHVLDISYRLDERYYIKTEPTDLIKEFKVLMPSTKYNM